MHTEWPFLVVEILFVLGIVMALRHFPWKHFNREYPQWRQHLFFASLVVLGVFWTARAAITPGLELHFLLLTTFTLMFLWPAAMLGVVIVYLGLALTGVIHWQDVVPQAVIWGFLPIAWITQVHRIIQKRFSHHLFIYVFATGFWGALSTLVVTTVAWAVWLELTGQVPHEKVLHEFLFVVPLLLFGEGFLNGALLTLMVVYRPQWVKSFSDKLYLSEKKSL